MNRLNVVLDTGFFQYLLAFLITVFIGGFIVEWVWHKIDEVVRPYSLAAKPREWADGAVWLLLLAGLSAMMACMIVGAITIFAYLFKGAL